MKIHFSSATIQSYENKDKTMDLFFNPIVIFENSNQFLIEQLKDVKFTIQSEKIGTHDFDVLIIQKPSLEDEEDKVFVEFRLSKKNVAFVYDNYSCKITFQASLEVFGEESISIEHEVLGIVKTKWSKGLV